ncbi:MAG: hypothetical protein GX825_06480 [Syntrophomonadaceae bacterium]|nr:hypothetical protein [Syntrophomonadaceae bacterium]
MGEELRIVLRNADMIDPTSIDDYVKAGGYKALEKARSMAVRLWEPTMLTTAPAFDPPLLSPGWGQHLGVEQ